MRVGALASDVKRELIRPGARGVVVGWASLIVVLAVLSAALGGDLGLYLPATFVGLPLLLLPLGAHLASRDRTTGLSEIHGVSPLTLRTWVLSRITTLATLTLWVAGISLLVSYAFAATATADPWRLVFPYTIWALILGTAAGAAGLSLGLLLPGHDRAATAGGFCLAIAWFFIGANAGTLLAASTGLGSTVLATVVHLTPTSWALATVQPVSPAAGMPDIEALAWALVPSVLTVTGLLIALPWLQTHRGWTGMEDAASRVSAGLLATLVLFSILVAAAGSPDLAPRDPGGEMQTIQRVQVGGLDVKASLLPPGEQVFATAGVDAEAILFLEIWGPPDDQVRLSDLTIVNPHLRIDPGTPLPRQVTLSPGPMEDQGRTTVEIPLRYTPIEAYRSYVVETSLHADGEPITLRLPLIVGGWTTGITSAGGAGLAGAGLPWLGLFLWARRWNR